MIKRAAIFAAALLVQTSASAAQDNASLSQASFIFDGKRIEIGLNAADAVKFASRFASLKASCDPHCVAPALVAVGIETVIEPQLLEFMVEAVGRNTGLLVDARMPADRALGFIPGSVSLPHQMLAELNDIRTQTLKALGARTFEDVYNFADAQTLMVYDNGPSQNDAGLLVAHLLEVGYPPEKIRYYRGGMQVWSVLALTVQE
jgi:rhodanese-related sulfurtransferase